MLVQKYCMHAVYFQKKYWTCTKYVQNILHKYKKMFVQADKLVLRFSKIKVTFCLDTIHFPVWPCMNWDIFGTETFPTFYFGGFLVCTTYLYELVIRQCFHHMICHIEVFQFFWQLQSPQFCIQLVYEDPLSFKIWVVARRL